jgi:nucleoside-diphosphate-sugar epimerase
MALSERPTPPARTALVIGATGGIGSEVAKALILHGWRVRALSRDPAKAAKDFAHLGPIEWVTGDAMKQADVVGAARGTLLIFHGANPPRYRNWRALAIPMLASAIAAAKASGARLIFPGSVYNFGPNAWPLIDERSPQQPQTRKGRIRVEMEQMLAQAADRGARSLVVRAGDFFGAHGPSSWFARVMVRPGQAVRSVIYPGKRDVGHAWAYLPDLSETIARLAEIEAELPAFDTVHFGGHWLEPGIEMAQAIRRVAGHPQAPIRRFPWPLVYLAAPFVALLREMIEMGYLWRVPLKLDNRKLVALIGTEPHTPLDEAVRQSLEGLACLPPEPVATPLVATG